MSPTPPAAAWKSTFSPGFTAWMRRSSIHAVIPFSMAAAATSSETPSGMRTRRSAGTAAASAYAPGGRAT